MYRQRNFLILLISWLLAGLSALAQVSKVSPKADSQPKTNSTKSTRTTKAQAGKGPQPATQPTTTPPDTAAKQAALTSKLTSSILDQQPELSGDYIPCKFTFAELRSLQAPEIALTLSSADAEKLKQSVIGAVISETPNLKSSGANLNKFIEEIGKESLVGLTPSQALHRIILLLQSFNEKEAKVNQPASQDDVNEIIGTISPVITQDHTSIVQAYSQELTSKLATAHPTRPALLDMAIATFPNWASKQHPILDANERELVKQALLNLKNQDLTSKREKAQSTASIVDAARKALAPFSRPTDVGCAMSILTWSEVDHAYGHLIADEYIAVQVVVRNLNKNQQFALHDVEFAVNSDPTGRFGRFFSGRDKVVVRALASAQTSFDPRNLVVHSAQGIGALLSAVSSVFGGNVVDASGVYNGAFATGLDKYWKDLSGEQLNLLNDTGFSSANNSQTVVPQTATVVFVTFIPAKQFEEGWWTQPCVETHYLGSVDKSGKLTNLATGTYNAMRAEGVSNPDLPSGIDVARALEICIRPDELPRSKRHWWLLGYRFEDNKVAELSTTYEDTHKDKDLFRNAYPRPYKKWSGNSMAIFRELSNVVVSGMHIIDENQLKPSIEQLKCPADDSGNLSFKNAKDAISCTLTGKNLDKFSTLRLRNAQDAADPDTVEGSVIVSGNSSEATVNFSTSRLRSLQGSAYSVFGVDAHGVETKTSQAIHLSHVPEVNTVTPKELDFSGKPSQTITVSGYYLAGITAIELKNSAGKTKTLNAASVPVPTDNQIGFTLNSTDLQADFSGEQTGITLSLIDKDNKSIPVTGFTLTIHGIGNKQSAKPKTAVAKPDTQPTVDSSTPSAAKPGPSPASTTKAPATKGRTPVKKRTGN
jgi:hypothetical protein